MAYCLLKGAGASLTLHRRNSALSGSVFTVGHSWVVGGPYLIRRKYRSDCGPDSGGSVTMESSSSCVELQSGYHCGGAVLGGGDGDTGFCDSVCY